MGVDLFLMTVTINRGKKPNWAAGEKHIAKLVAMDPTKWTSGLLDAFDYDELPDVSHADDSQAKKDMADIVENVRKSLKEDLAELRGLWTGSRRDADVLTICHKKVVISGGISHGDAPTDFFSTMDRLIRSGVTRACGFDY